MIKYNFLHRLSLMSMLFFTFTFFITDVNAQWDDWGDTPVDSSQVDSTDGGDWGSDWGSEETPFDYAEEENTDKGTPPKPIKKYERIDFIPVDTLTKLITYTAVHDVESSCNYCTADSLYFRIKKYLLTKYGDGKKLPKGWVVEDVTNQRIIMKVRLPLYTHPNPYSKVQEGEYEFKFQLWIRDYAYKYKFTQIVHFDPVINGKPGDFTPVYLEYYLKNKTKVRFTDMILTAIDSDMKSLIDDIIRVMKDPVTVDIDEEDF
ncbi:MAG: hypothetical protein J5I91_03725 [Bacteroidetes bacterium]|nr:hypothetical protein [Bacteroidota bacterium]